MEFVDTSIVEQIEMKMIRPSQFAVRANFHDTDGNEVETLVSSIREHGLLQPILIRPLDHGFEIVAGHRRFQACRSLRWHYISCKIRELSDKQTFEIQLTENLQRKSMDPIEEAEAFRRYIVEFGWGGVTELARKIGKSEEFVSHRLQLLKLPPEVKEQCSLNKINVSQAIELTTVPSSRQSELLRQIIDGDLSVREIRQVKSATTIEVGEEGALERERDDIDSYHFDCYSIIYQKHRSAKIARKTILALRVTLARLDSIIHEVHQTVPPKERAEVISMLMGIRLKVHSLIDEAIQFRKFKETKLK